MQYCYNWTDEPALTFTHACKFHFLVIFSSFLSSYRQWKQLAVLVLQGTVQDTADLQVWHCEERAGQGQEGGRHQRVCERSVLEGSAWWSEFNLIAVLCPRGLHVALLTTPLLCRSPMCLLRQTVKEQSRSVFSVTHFNINSYFN